MDSQGHKPRTLLVGIDAADPDYLDRRFAEGALPNLNAFRKSGSWGRMRSTFPVLSSAAWSTIATGLPPEKHGIYEFFRRKPGTWQDEPVHGAMKRGEDVWKIAARHGLRTVTINMPITYPPATVPDGVVVSGMDTPGESAEFVSPGEEKAPLLKAVPGYRIEQTAAQFRTVEDFLATTSQTMEARKKAAFFLFERWRPDLAIVIFTALDRVLHALWKYMDPEHPAYNRPEAEGWRKRVDGLYDEVDRHFGELLEWAGPDTVTIVCSDHGGAAVHGVFYLNRWLMREGYLSLRDGGSSLILKAGVSAQKWVKKNVPRSLKNIANRIAPEMYSSVETRHGLSRIDPEQTRLYAWRKADVIRVSLAGREPGGIVRPGKEYDELLSEVKAKLEAVSDPRNDRRPIRKVWTRDEAYPLADPHEDCPDLVIEWADRLYSVDTTFDNPRGPLFGDAEKPGKPWNEEVNGDHALHGVFGVAGGKTASGHDIGTVDILTVAPSVLRALGLAKPEEMPGEPPAGVFPAGEMSTESSSTAGGRGQDDSDNVYSDEDQELIEKRLRDLGYM